MTTGNFLEAVKAQYEALPYPPRDPALETRRLIHKIGDNLIILNHYCFGGSRDFSRGFRVLVAGGGTGDSTIYLAEQLRQLGGEVVYLDLSEASLAIARERARIRGIENIRWFQASIMDIPALELGSFDYINCTGVLHHLASTEAGLGALKSVLKPDGVILLMLYGKYGRRSVYDMQSLLRQYVAPDGPISEQVAQARRLVDVLPPTNSFARDREKWSREIAIDGFGDAGLYDLLLHSQDRCFSVPDLYGLAASASLDILAFVDHVLAYDLTNLLPAGAIPPHVLQMELSRRQALAELLIGDIASHEFYLGFREIHRPASLDDDDNTLVMLGKMHGHHAEIAAGLQPGRTITFEGRSGRLTITGTPVNRLLFAHMDGRTPLSTIYNTIIKAVPGVTRAGIEAELSALYGKMHAHGHLFLLRQGSYGTKVPDFTQMQPF
ncbi:MAG: class I SAM-dependent methyltransferase [Chromatiales bacterium]|jgi:SAM-dependent methyltransferase|nr:class I SAM-dependent methyltransferase [Chromatiales bacterium]